MPDTSLAGFLSVFEVIPVDRAIAELSRATLVTLNRKHFPMVVPLDSPYRR